MSEEKDKFQTPSQIKNKEPIAEIDGIGFDKIKKVKIERSNYDVEGMFIGAAAGFIVGIIISFNIIFATEIGIFVGLAVGTMLKKQKKNKNT
ncbi:hypothetical protein AGMMS49593_01440 [Endomicrobiia bacterium]|nr:hypothetical protein AGMMS49593_01440 [Endomicrobiia bacterium]